jgi:uncharacterized membrane protein (UPF0127 family)
MVVTRRTVFVLTISTFVFGIGLLAYYYHIHHNKELIGSVQMTELQVSTHEPENFLDIFSDDDQAVIDTWFTPLVPMSVADVPVYASVADTFETRMMGLSNTPYLPSGVVKLFVFSNSQPWSFWMKDMKYSIDIMWVQSNGIIVHIEEQVSPDTFPAQFTPNQPAQYVIEATSGFVAEHRVSVGDTVTLPKNIAIN